MAPTGAAFQLGTGSKGKGVEDGRRVLRQPRGIRVCADGDLLVADYGNHCVLRFRPGDSAGSVVAGEEGRMLPTVDLMKDIDKPLAFPQEEGVLLKQPGDACEDPSGGILVLDTDEGSVQRFVGKERGVTLVPQGGKSMNRSLGAPEAVKNPRALAVAPDGALLVCDTWSHRVLRYPPPGSPEAFEKPTVVAGSSNSWGKSASQLAFPSSVACTPDGTLLVVDTNNHRVQRFESGRAEGVTVAGSAEGEPGDAPDRLNMPTCACLDPKDGSMLVTDRANSRVLRFPAGSRAGTPGVEVAGRELVQAPWGVCIGPDGAIWVSDDRRAVVLRLEVEPGAPPSAPQPVAGNAASTSDLD